MSEQDSMVPCDSAAHLFSLYMETRALPPEQRRQRIRERCNDDPELMRQLNDLLEDDRLARESAPREGTLLAARYTLERRLGSGASAAVWCAYDNKLARRVALKIFHWSACDQGALQRALREAQAASHIVSDHVVRVRDAAYCGLSGAYIDMELCADFVDGQWQLGQSMADTRPRNRRELLHWVVQAARGVQAAHEQGVFHRDIKPDNVLIRPASRIALVTDFGLALQPLRPAMSDSAVTARTGASADGGGEGQRSRVYAGTPCYMAPEQAEGLSRDLDPEVPEDGDRLARVDVYGLGALLYAMLAGGPPYLPRASACDPVLDVMLQVRGGAPPALRGWLSWSGVGRPVPARLRRIVQKAMARDPWRRYPSCAALADDLKRFLGLQPTSLDAHRFLTRTRLWCARKWRTLIPAATVALAGCMLGYTQVLSGENARLRATVEAAALQLSAAQAERGRIGAERVASSAGQERSAALGAAAAYRERVTLVERQLQQLRRRGAAADAAAQRRAEQAASQQAAAIDGWLAKTAVPDFMATSIPANAGDPEPPAALRPPSAQRSHSQPAPTRGGLAAKTFIDRVRRTSARLTRLVRDGATVGYCFVHSSGERVEECVASAGLSDAAERELRQLHKRRGDERTWHLNAQGRLLEQCTKVKVVGTHLRRWSCRSTSEEFANSWSLEHLRAASFR